MMILKIVKSALVKETTKKNHYQKNRIQNDSLYKKAKKKHQIKTIQDVSSRQRGRDQIFVRQSTRLDLNEPTCITIKSPKEKKANKTQIKLIDKNPRTKDIETISKIKQTILTKSNKKHLNFDLSNDI